MIKVNLYNFGFTEEIRIIDIKKKCRIKVEGHSGLGKKGSDIVCSAASAIIQTAIASVAETAKLKQKISQKEGFISTDVEIRNADEYSLNALKIIVNTMIIGLKLIKDHYPESLEITFEK